MCPGTQRDRGQKRNGAHTGFSRGEPRPRHGSRALLEEGGRVGGIGIEASWFFRHTSTNEYIRVIFFYSLPYEWYLYLRIYYIYIYIRDPSVSWPIYGEGGERTRGDGGEEGGGEWRGTTAREPWNWRIKNFGIVWRLFGNWYIRVFRFIFSLGNNWT